MTKNEYEAALAKFVENEKAELTENKPTGFFGEWAFYANRKEKFDRQLKENNITVE